jgi:phosphoadenosine phosphosulfate reductase
MAALWQPPQAPWTRERERASAAAGALLAQVADAYPRAAIATSLQAEEAVLVDIAAKAGASLDLFMLDTGRLHPETLAAKAALEVRYGKPIAVFAPDRAEIAAWIASFGEDAFYEGRDRRQECCAIRKVAPLKRALAGRGAWITGQRREQAASRGGLAEREFDAAHGIDKFNPLAAWSLEDVWAYVARHELPVNALYARGYASIGCEPCTRPIRVHEDARAGRWWWEQSAAKECGLHVGPNLIEA